MGTVGISVRGCQKESIIAFELCWEICGENLRKPRFVLDWKLLENGSNSMAGKSSCHSIGQVRRMFVCCGYTITLFVSVVDVSFVQQFPFIKCDFLSQKNTLTVFGCEQIYKLKMNLSLQHSYYAKLNFQALSSI